MAYKLEFTLAGLPPTSNGAHGSWKAAWQRRKKWRDAVRLRCFLQRPDKPLPLAKITFIRCSSREPDYDNLVTSFKPVCDGLKDAGIIEDDSPKHVERVYLWEKANTKYSRIRVIVEAQ